MRRTCDGATGTEGFGAQAKDATRTHAASAKEVALFAPIRARAERTDGQTRARTRMQAPCHVYTQLHTLAHGWQAARLGDALSAAERERAEAQAQLAQVGVRA